jgi:O-antigen/teichoic acid export membrane protein
MKGFVARFMPSKGSLGARTLSAGAWSLGSAGATFFLRLASNLIMTRLLAPEAFGILAFAVTFAAAVGLLTDMGIHQSIVREKALTPRFLRVAFTVRILRGLVIAGGVLVCAGVFAFVGPAIASPDSAMAWPYMPYLIAMTALMPIMEGFLSSNFDVAKRELRYKNLLVVEVLGHLFRILCQVGFALLSPTVWALFVGAIAGGLGKVVLSHLYLPGPRMRLRLQGTGLPRFREEDRPIVEQLWTFGKWIMGSSGMTFIINQGDKILFGFLVPGVSLGLYMIAYVWIGAAQTIVVNFTNSVGFPVVSEIIRNRAGEARRLIRKYQFMIDGLCFAGFLVLLLFGPLIVEVLYTDEYFDAGRITQLLSPIILSLRYRQLGNVVMALGNTRAVFVMATLVAVGTVVFIYAGFEWFGGFDAAVTGAVLARFASFPYLLVQTASFFGWRQTLFDACWGVFSVAITIAIYVI